MPFAAGGAGDIWARFAVEGMSRELGQPMPVENRPGAGGMSGSEFVARSTPDGYTLLFTISALFQAPIILRRFPYDPLNDFAPIGRFGVAGLFFVVGPSVPAEITTLRDFVGWAREREVRLGSNGPGGTAHALIALLARDTGPRTTIAQYRSEVLQAPDIIGGRIHGGFQSLVLTPELVRAGQARALAASGEQRVPTLPDVPTFIELGFSPRFAFAGFSGLFAPARTPEAVLVRLRDAFGKVAQAPATQQWLRGLGVTPGYQDGAAFRMQIESDMQSWREMVETLGIASEL
jgi:tripartite-type tricarboxylate transporter receptor subunit TctC